MIPTFARTWMLAVGVLLVIVPSIVAIATRRRGWLRPGGLSVVLFGAALVWPLFRLEYLDNWPSIESTFIADARMLAAVKVPVLFTHHFRHVNETTGVVMGATSRSYAARSESSKYLWSGSRPFRRLVKRSRTSLAAMLFLPV